MNYSGAFDNVLPLIIVIIMIVFGSGYGCSKMIDSYSIKIVKETKKEKNDEK